MPILPMQNATATVVQRPDPRIAQPRHPSIHHPFSNRTADAVCYGTTQENQNECES